MPPSPKSTPSTPSLWRWSSTSRWERPTPGNAAHILICAGWPSASIAIAADSASGLHIADLAGLPSTISRVQLLEPADLGGLSPAGQVDCTPQCCYADNTDAEIMVLCP